MAKGTYFKMSRRAARIEAAEKAKRDAEVRRIRDFFMAALHMPAKEALAKANELVGK